MKKVLAMVLATLLLAGLLPMAAFAAPQEALAEADVYISCYSDAERTTAQGTATANKLILSKSDKRIALIRFPLPPLPDGETLTSATLYLYLADGITEASNPLKLARAPGDDAWDEATLTYNTAAQYIPSEYPITNLKLPVGPKDTPIPIDVLSLIKDDYAAGKAKTTIAVTLDATAGSDLTIRSKEANPNYTARLEVDSKALSGDDAAVEADKAALSLGDTSFVTKNLTLPLQGENGSAITWESSDAGVITAQGAVTRPQTGVNATATLTATLTKGQAGTQKTFDITVLAIKYPTDDTYTEANDTNYGTEGVLKIREDGRFQTFLKFQLPAIPEGKVVKSATLRLYKTNNVAGSFAVRRIVDSWDELSVKHSTAVPGNDGAYSFPWAVPATQNDYISLDVTALAASCYTDSLSNLNIAIGGSESTKGTVNFQSKEGANKPELLVEFDDRTVQADVDAAAAALTLGNTSAVQKNLTLPIAGLHDTTITWATSNASVITADGVVTRPAVNQPDAAATLTATVSKAGATSKDVEFAITVLSNRTPLADTFVGSDKPDTPNGSVSDTLITKLGGPTRKIFVKYDLSGMEGMFTSAKFRMNGVYNYSGNDVDASTQILIAVDDNSWDEDTLTYNTAGELLARTKVVATGSFYAGDTDDKDGTYIEFDLTDYANERLLSDDKMMSFVLFTTHPDTNFNFRPKEHADKPVLEVALTTEEPQVSLLRDKAALVINDVVTQDLTFAEQGDNGSSIAWTVNNSAIDPATGVVTRPAQGQPDAVGTIKAVLTNGGETMEKVFAVTVPAYRGVTAAYTFEPADGAASAAEAKRLTVTATYANDTTAAATAQLLVAKYDADGRLVAAFVTAAPAELTVGGTGTQSLEIDTSDMQAGCRVVAYSWDNLTTMRPYNSRTLSYE